MKTKAEEFRIQNEIMDEHKQVPRLLKASKMGLPMSKVKPAQQQARKQLFVTLRRRAQRNEWLMHGDWAVFRIYPGANASSWIIENHISHNQRPIVSLAEAVQFAKEEVAMLDLHDEVERLVGNRDNLVILAERMGSFKCMAIKRATWAWEDKDKTDAEVQADQPFGRSR